MLTPTSLLCPVVKEWWWWWEGGPQHTAKFQCTVCQRGNSKAFSIRGLMLSVLHSLPGDRVPFKHSFLGKSRQLHYSSQSLCTISQYIAELKDKSSCPYIKADVQSCTGFSPVPILLTLISLHIVSFSHYALEAAASRIKSA